MGSGLGREKAPDSLPAFPGLCTSSVTLTSEWSERYRTWGLRLRITDS